MNRTAIPIKKNTLTKQKVLVAWHMFGIAKNDRGRQKDMEERTKKEADCPLRQKEESVTKRGEGKIN